MKLSGWQRVKRRISLWGGSYQHPDETIELDIDEKAGIDPTVDSNEVQDAKFRRYFAHQRTSGPRNLGGALIALAVFLILTQADFPFWLAVLVAAMVGAGLHLLVTGRWHN